jgi:hypothetical protein
LPRLLPKPRQKPIHLSQPSTTRSDRITLHIVEHLAKPTLHIRRRFPCCIEERNCSHKRLVNRFEDAHDRSAKRDALKLREAFKRRLEVRRKRDRDSWFFGCHR